MLGFGHFPLSTRLTVVWSGLFAMTWICLAILRCNERLLVFSIVCLMQAVVGIGIGTLVAYFHLHLATDVLWCAVVVQAGRGRVGPGDDHARIGAASGTSAPWAKR